MFDLLIVGSGPAALTAAIYAARDGLNVQIFEKELLGGLVSTSEMVENYPGFPDGVSGLELSKRMREQAEKLGAKISFGEVKNISKKGNLFEVLVDNSIIEAKTILLAPGNSYRKLGVKNEEKFLGKGIHFCATCDGAMYFGKKIIAVGGGDTAIQEALFLTRFSKVKLFVRSKIRAQKVLRDRLEEAEKLGKIEVVYGAKITEFIGEDKLRSVAVDIVGESSEVAVDGVFEFIGLKPNTKFLADSGILLSENGEILISENMETNISGIYAAGDAVFGAEKQIITAAADGAKAALKIRELLA